MSDRKRNLKAKPRYRGSIEVDLDAAASYFRKGVDGLRSSCKDGAPWVFLSASAFLEYLAKLVEGQDKGRDGYKNFVRNWMNQVRPLYRDFVYKSGEQDLDVQMYHVLRCGIVHNFSLIPDTRARAKGGRDRSIVLCHAEERDKNNWTHLMQYQTSQITDAALFVAEDFVDDIGKVTDMIFTQAATDQKVRDNIEKWLHQYPPITGGF